MELKIDNINESKAPLLAVQLLAVEISALRANSDRIASALEEIASTLAAFFPREELRPSGVDRVDGVTKHGPRAGEPPHG